MFLLVIFVIFLESLSRRGYCRLKLVQCIVVMLLLCSCTFKPFANHIPNQLRHFPIVIESVFELDYPDIGMRAEAPVVEK
jgi:hypothetical protein